MREKMKQSMEKKTYLWRRWVALGSWSQIGSRIGLRYFIANGDQWFFLSQQAEKRSEYVFFSFAKHLVPAIIFLLVKQTRR